MGLDRAPIEFWKLVFLVPPSAQNSQKNTQVHLLIQKCLFFASQTWKMSKQSFAFHQRKLVSQRMVIYAKRQPFKLWPYQVDKEDKAKEKYWNLECENTETWQKIKENT